MRIRLKNNLCLDNIPPAVKRELIKTLTLPNPRWIENERMGRWNGDTPKLLRYYHQSGSSLCIPRGYTRQLIHLCREHHISYRIDDQRRSLTPIQLHFKGHLRPYQQRATARMLAKEFGTLSAPPGAGKTIMGLFMIAQRRQPALVIVHTKDLAYQWIERASEFLALKQAEIGLIGDGKLIVGERLSIALVQSLYKCAGQVAPHIGHLVVDECHRIPSRTFTEAVDYFDARYMLGLSATPWRRDKLSRLIFWYLGDMHHHVDSAQLLATGDVLPARIVFKQTCFIPFHDPLNEYAQMLGELASDDQRNRQIAADIAHEVDQNDGICLVLSDRKAHCQNLQLILRYRHHLEALLLTGDMPIQQRRSLLERLNQGAAKVLIATGQLVGEGFDCRHLTTLFLATPIRFSGRLLQYMGRILRPAPDKNQAQVFDYVDIKVAPLAAAAAARRKIYRQFGSVVAADTAKQPLV